MQSLRSRVFSSAASALVSALRSGAAVSRGRDFPRRLVASSPVAAAACSRLPLRCPCCASGQQRAFSNNANAVGLTSHAAATAHASSTAGFAGLSAEATPPPQPPSPRNPVAVAALSRVRELDERTLSLFPRGSRSLARHQHDLKSKPDWVSLRAEMAAALAELLRVVAEGELHLRPRDWEGILIAVQRHFLFDLWLPCLQMMLSVPHALLPLSSDSAPSGFAAMDSPSSALEGAASDSHVCVIGAKTATLLLECAARAEVAPEPPLLPNQPAGLRGAELAEWLLAFMQQHQAKNTEGSPYFKLDGHAYNIVLQALTERVEAGDSLQHLSAVRLCFDSIPVAQRTVRAHCILINALHRANQWSEANQLMDQLLADPSMSVSPGLIAARLGAIHARLEAAHASDLAVPSMEPLAPIVLPAEVEQIWTQIQLDPHARLNPVVLAAMVKLHTLVGDTRRIFQIIEEAWKIEQQQARATNSTAPVLLDAGVLSAVFHAASLSVQPQSWSYPIDGLYKHLLKREAEAIAKHDLSTLRQLGIGDEVYSSYIKFLQRSRQDMQLWATWHVLAERHKQSNGRVYLALLNSLAPKGDTLRATDMVQEIMARDGELSSHHFNAWLSVCKRVRQIDEGEALWALMPRLNLAPTHYTYAELIMLYMHAADPDQTTGTGSGTQFHKIELVYAQMLRGVSASTGGGASAMALLLPTPAHPPLHFTAREFNHLILTARKLRLDDEMLKWASRAEAAPGGVWRRIDSRTRELVTQLRAERAAEDHAAQNQHQNRPQPEQATPTATQ